MKTGILRARTKEGERFYEVKNFGGSPEIYIYDEIAWYAVSAQMIIDDLNAIGFVNEITVRLGSPGGDSIEAMNIYNMLVRHPAKIKICVDSCALSAAATIMLAGDTIEMAENAVVMFHRPWSVVAGNEDDLKDRISQLKINQGQIAKIMTDANRKGMTTEQANDVMRGEVDGTWFDANMALEAGLVDAITENKKIAAHFDPKRFAGVPDKFLAWNGAQPDEPGSKSGDPATVDEARRAAVQGHIDKILS